MSPDPEPLDLDSLGRYDSLYVSPHAEDAAISCPGGIFDERAQGLRLLVVTLFGPRTLDTSEAGPTARLGADGFAAGLPSAQERTCRDNSFRSILSGGQSGDASSVAEAARILGEVVRRVVPRHVYVPLGVWGHVDHRICHEAARRAVETKADRDVFFYEERPFGLLPSAVKIRLAQIGARLPPGAPRVSDDGSFARFLIGFGTDPYVRRHFHGWWDGLQCARLAARQWHEARQWRPLKAFGPRLQPALHPVPAAAIELLQESCEAFPGGSPFGSRERLDHQLARHARCLGQSGPVERYWLLLPQTEEAVPDLDDLGDSAHG
jgi:hypothetical protein